MDMVISLANGTFSVKVTEHLHLPKKYQFAYKGLENKVSSP
jgi:hypothetical protein